MVRLGNVFLGSIGCLIACNFASAAEEVLYDAPVGSEWVGVWRNFSSKADPKERVTSADARLKITGRDGEKFQAELWLEDGKKGLALEGTIATSGASNLKGQVAKVLKGEFAQDIVGRTRIEGYLRSGVLNAKYQIPGGARFGELELKRRAKE
jgi:hypothetical protein